MEISKLSKILSENSYPGRGIAIGLTPDGKKLAVAYFIMGRSENSRNRIFVADGSDLRTKAFDEKKLTDPSLIIYYPVRVLGNHLIVTNGDQTDTVFEALKNNTTFEVALNSREFEPDAPNFTPRISGIVEFQGKEISYKLSILKTLNGNENTSIRNYFQFDKPESGKGHFIHTYQEDGNPLPSFEGEPRLIETNDDIDEFTNEIWSYLNKDNKVSLFVRYVDLTDLSVATRIKNVHENGGL